MDNDLEERILLAIRTWADLNVLLIRKAINIFRVPYFTLYTWIYGCNPRNATYQD